MAVKDNDNKLNGDMGSGKATWAAARALQRTLKIEPANTYLKLHSHLLQAEASAGAAVSANGFCETSLNILYTMGKKWNTSWSTLIMAIFVLPAPVGAQTCTKGTLAASSQSKIAFADQAARSLGGQGSLCREKVRKVTQ